jgi:DeoR family glycerol-3-phosphate regulon repressor
MPAASRDDAILALVRDRGYVGIEELARLCRVTPQTMRRDLNRLAESGRLRRHHGGASAASSTANVAYAERRHELRREKQRIARAVSEAIPDRASLFLAIGTTGEAIAAELARREGLKVVTNSTAAALILNQASGIEVFLTGGTMRKANHGLVGVTTVEAVQQFRCDLAVMSCGGIEQDGTLVDFEHAEVMVMRAMIAHARGVLVAADHTKMHRPAAVRLAHLREVTTLVTDQGLPPRLAAIARDCGTRVVVAA